MAIQVGTNTRVITVAGGNLFALAAQYLQDATQWNRIARLNGIRDPMLVGIVTLKIPDVNASAGNGGLLGV